MSAHPQGGRSQPVEPSGQSEVDEPDPAAGADHDEPETDEPPRLLITTPDAERAVVTIEAAAHRAALAAATFAARAAAAWHPGKAWRVDEHPVAGQVRGTSIHPADALAAPEEAHQAAVEVARWDRLHQRADRREHYITDPTTGQTTTHLPTTRGPRP